MKHIIEYQGGGYEIFVQVPKRKSIMLSMTTRSVRNLIKEGILDVQNGNLYRVSNTFIADSITLVNTTVNSRLFFQTYVGPKNWDIPLCSDSLNILFNEIPGIIYLKEILFK